MIVCMLIVNLAGTLFQSNLYMRCRYLPYIGQATIIMNDYPYVKYLLIGILGIFVITSKE